MDMFSILGDNFYDQTGEPQRRRVAAGHSMSEHSSMRVNICVKWVRK